MGLATTELVFVELSATDASEAGGRVRDAADALGLGAAWQIAEVLPDPRRAGAFGVELLAPPDTSVAGGWNAAHALSAELGEDARVEAALAATLERAEAWELAPYPQVLEGTASEAGADAPEHEWHLEVVGAARAWALASGRGVRIGHPDTGGTRHPELANRVRFELGANLLEAGEPVDPLEGGAQPGHGTSTASLMVSPPGAQIANGRPVSGLSPEAEIVPIRVTETVVILTWQRRLAQAIEHAVATGCQVISLSLGGLPGSRLRRAIAAALEAGVIVVAAAGNRVRFVVWPAAYPEVIGVAASGPDGRPWPSSSRGERVDVTAPGADVWVARWLEGQPQVGRGSGTSYSAALVASAAALWVDRHRDAIGTRLRGPQVQEAFRAALRATARPFAEGVRASGFGSGVLDCGALLAASLADEPALSGAAAHLEAISAGPVLDLCVADLIDALAGAAPGGGIGAAEDGSEACREVARGARAAVAGLRGPLATELLHHLVLDRTYREALLRSRPLEVGGVGVLEAGAPPAPVPGEASGALRARLRTHPG